MIEIPRSFIRQLRTVLRKAFNRLVSPVVLEASSAGLSVRCQQDGIAVAYQSKERHGNDFMVLPAQALADIDGKGQEIVALEVRGSKVQARWLDAGVPRVMECDSLDARSLPAFPERPPRMSHQDGSLLKALDDAMQSASHDTVRFALNKIQIVCVYR